MLEQPIAAYRIAARFAKQHGLVPPVDIMSIVQRYADVSLCHLPIKGDGIVVNLKHPSRKPAVFISKGIAKNRQKFTLAHELGHIVIPWHVGAIVSNLDPASNDPAYFEIETEANAFASEVLMPLAWLRDMHRKHRGNISELHRRVADDAEVSLAAAAKGLVRFIEPGYVFAEIDGSDVVRVCGKSEHTPAAAPLWEETIEHPADYYLNSSAHHSSSNGQTTFHWWVFDLAVQKPRIRTKDTRSWQEVFDVIADDLRFDESERKALTRSISGVVGSANNTRNRDTPGLDLFNLVRARLSDRAKTRPLEAKLMAHADVDLFLVKRTDHI